MLEVILYPVQGRSVGEGPFNREVDICEWTFEEKKTTQNDSLQQLLLLPLIPNWIKSNGKTETYLTDSTASPLRGWGGCCWRKAGSVSRGGVSLKVSSITGQKVDKRSFRVFRLLRVWVWHMAATSGSIRGLKKNMLSLVKFNIAFCNFSNLSTWQDQRKILFHQKHSFIVRMLAFSKVQLHRAASVATRVYLLSLVFNMVSMLFFHKYYISGTYWRHNKIPNQYICQLCIWTVECSLLKCGWWKRKHVHITCD